jgi:hypothetical protein
MLVDFAHGRSIRFDAMATAPRFWAPVPESPGGFVAFGARSTARIQLHLDEAAPRVELLKESMLDAQSSRGGRIFRVSSSGRWAAEVSDQLTLTDLTTLERRAVDLGPLTVTRIVPVPNSDAFVLSGGLRHEGSFTHWLWSFEDGSMAKVKVSELGTNQFEYLPTTGKLGLIDGPRMTFADTVPAEDVVPLEAFLADATMQANEAKMRRALAQSQAGTALPPAASAGDLRAPSVSASGSPGMLGPLPAGTRVEGIGIYGTKRSGSARPGAGSPKPRVLVRVRSGGSPTVLVLSSYEAVTWDLRLDTGARLQAVLVSGYEPSDVVGAGGARVARIGQAHAHGMAQSGYATLNGSVTRWTGGSTIGSFQGSYYGETFEVGGR